MAHRFFNHLNYIGFFEQVYFHDLQKRVVAPRQMKSFLHDRHEQVNDHGDPDLRLHGVGRGTVERLDPQMLLDPFEEQFDLLPLPICVRDHLRWNIDALAKKSLFDNRLIFLDYRSLFP